MDTKIEINLTNDEVMHLNLPRNAFFPVLSYFIEAPQHGFSNGGENHYNLVLPTHCHGAPIGQNPLMSSIVPYQLDNMHLPHLIKLRHTCYRSIMKTCGPGAGACGKCEIANDDITDLKDVIAAAAKCPPSCKKINSGGCKGRCRILSPIFRRIKEKRYGC